MDARATGCGVGPADASAAWLRGEPLGGSLLRILAHVISKTPAFKTFMTRLVYAIIGIGKTDSG